MADKIRQPWQPVIAVDFDGTCVKHACPYIGEDIGAAPVLRELVGAGALLILWTVRSGDTLEDALQWFKRNEIPLYGVNANPEQGEWSDSPKALADLYIDDRALGVPLLRPPLEPPFVDWARVREMLKPFIDYPAELVER
jgi:hypothetical protein